ncbi:hypothetical protein OHB12_08675 [Nocardia sp. NBC_01730]|uniref:hypothetical protein n=1 Tax=Nocardia sp. NBC_01730 TaxID=2975998 RepID=UPI002E15BE26|nr:hypothetical protein OHB12_08675 [Nocardia sp. NBC_01730]
MGKYVAIYTGYPAEDSDPHAVRASWEQWFRDLGAAVIDPGSVFTAARTVTLDGSVIDGNRTKLTGYTILAADDLDAAAAMVTQCPGLANAAIEVYEAVGLDAV